MEREKFLTDKQILPLPSADRRAERNRDGYQKGTRDRRKRRDGENRRMNGEREM